MLAFVVLLRV